jgi:transmembrane sensor
METSNFDDLLQRYLEGKASPEEKAKIEAWLEVRKTKKATDLELTKEDEERLFRKIVSKTTPMKEVTDFLPGHRKPFPFRLLGIAASVVLVAIVAFIFLTDVNGLFNQNNTADNKLILNDGSIVWLASNKSTLSYYEKDGIRYCDLHGDALFEVAKDPDHPFIIHSGTVSLKVLGTSFHVRHSGDSLELSVLTGKVQISTPEDPEGIQVVAHEKAIAITDGKIVRGSLEPVSIGEVTQGTEYNMEFEDQKLQQVFERIERKFDVRMQVGNGSINDCRITADFTDHSLKSTLSMISEVLGVQFTIEGNTVQATGSGCR